MSGAPMCPSVIVFRSRVAIYGSAASFLGLTGCQNRRTHHLQHFEHLVTGVTTSRVWWLYGYRAWERTFLCDGKKKTYEKPAPNTLLSVNIFVVDTTAEIRSSCDPLVSLSYSPPAVNTSYIRRFSVTAGGRFLRQSPSITIKSQDRTRCGLGPRSKESGLAPRRTAPHHSPFSSLSDSGTFSNLARRLHARSASASSPLSDSGTILVLDLRIDNHTHRRLLRLPVGVPLRRLHATRVGVQRQGGAVLASGEVPPADLNEIAEREAHRGRGAEVPARSTRHPR